MWVIPAPLPQGNDDFVALLRLLCQAYRKPYQIEQLVARIPQSADMISRIGFDGGEGVEPIWTQVLHEAVARKRIDALFTRMLEDPASENFHSAIRQRLEALRALPAAGAGGSLRSRARDGGTLGELRDELLDELHAIEETVGLPDEGDLVRLLWASAVDVGPLPVAAVTDISAVVDDLDSRMRAGPQEMPPVLAFLEYYAAHSDARDRLQQLVDRLAQQLGVGLRERARVRENAESSTLDVELALVYVEVGDEGDEHVRPQLWLYRPDTPVSFKQEADAVCRRDDTGRVVQGLIATVAPLLGGLPLRNLRFEFVLPFAMFDVAVDEWCFDDGREIGLNSQVVIRSLDRLRYPLGEDDWKRRSACLGDLGDVPPEKLVRRSGSAMSPFRSLTELDPLILLTLDEAYRPPESWTDPDELLDAIKGGLPGALWYRRGGDPEALLNLALAETARAALHRLPGEVLRMRQEAHAAGPQDLRRYISLFWDDFDTRPVRRRALRNTRTRGGAR